MKIEPKLDLETADVVQLSNQHREDLESIRRLKKRLVERESELLRFRDAFHHLKEELLEDRGLRCGCKLCDSSSYHEEDCPIRAGWRQQIKGWPVPMLAGMIGQGQHQERLTGLLEAFKAGD